MKPVKFFSMLFFFLGQASMIAWGQSWAFGLHIGENLSTLTGDQNYDYRLGFMGGVHASHYLTENIVMRLEINLERKGARGEQITPIPQPGEEEWTNDYRLDYLSLPVMLRYSTGNKSKFIAGGGISFDYLLQEKVGFRPGFPSETRDFRRFDNDLIACIGGALALSEKLTFTMEMRGMWGLINVSKPEGVARELGRNVSWGLMAGLNYYL